MTTLFVFMKYRVLTVVCLQQCLIYCIQQGSTPDIVVETYTDLKIILNKYYACNC